METICFCPIEIWNLNSTDLKQFLTLIEGLLNDLEFFPNLQKSLKNCVG